MKSWNELSLWLDDHSGDFLQRYMKLVLSHSQTAFLDIRFVKKLFGQALGLHFSRLFGGRQEEKGAFKIPH